MLRVHVLRHINENVSLIDINITGSDVGFSGGSVDPNCVSGISCDSNVFVGAIIRFSNGIAVNAIANNASNANWIGLVIEKPGATCCTLRLPSLSTAVFSALTQNSSYFLSDSSAGQISLNFPTAHNAVITPVGTAFNSERLSIIKMTQTIRRT